MATIILGVTNILQNIFFCVQWKNEIHTGLEQLEGWVQPESQKYLDGF